MRRLAGIALAVALAACGSAAETGETIPTTPASASSAPSPSSTSTTAAPADGEESTPTTTTTTVPRTPVLEAIASGFDRPIWIGSRPGDGAVLIAEQTGRLWNLDTREVVLDLSGQVSGGGEQGLLGIAFADGRMFVNYTDPGGTTVISEFDAAAPSAETVLVSFRQPAGNHNGGGLEFGPDGLLWIGTGDGGRANDAFGHGQDETTPLGAMLRYDISEPGIAQPAGGFTGGDPAVWAIGLRNPWRYTFDGEALIVADVGQNQWEEVSVVDAGLNDLNFGWPILEGSACFESCDAEGTVLPAIEYNHSDGCSVTGGVVYRGTQLSQLAGHYLYADYCRGWIRAAELVASGQGWDLTGDRELFNGVGNVTSFGTDSAGEILITEHSGTIYRLTGV